jgi:hypothetical protein
MEQYLLYYNMGIKYDRSTAPCHNLCDDNLGAQNVLETNGTAAMLKICSSPARPHCGRRSLSHTALYIRQ